MPDYIKLCMKTWKFDYVLLNYENLMDYTVFEIEKTKRFTLPQMSDAVRVHVLRDQGGIWLDADTIMLTDQLPKENMVGIPEERAAHCGYLNFEKYSQMLVEWSKNQDDAIRSNIVSGSWDIFANGFSDKYIKSHLDITIKSRELMFPELYVIPGNKTTKEKYLAFYFEKNCTLDSIKPADMLMLHNSWTPSWYKELSEKDLLERECTMSNILREVAK